MNKEERLLSKISGVDKAVFVQVLDGLSKPQKKKILKILRIKSSILNAPQRPTTNTHTKRKRGKFV